jgi:hypothetical protein
MKDTKRKTNAPYLPPDNYQVTANLGPLPSFLANPRPSFLPDPPPYFAASLPCRPTFNFPQSLTTNVPAPLAISPDSPTPVPAQYTKDSITFESKVTPRITPTRTNSSLSAEAAPYVPAAERSPSYPSNRNLSNLPSFQPLPSNQDTVAPTNPWDLPFMTNTLSKPALGAPSAQQPLSGSSSYRPLVVQANHSLQPLTFPSVPSLNPWNITANASFNPSSSPWRNTESTPAVTNVATATPETSRTIKEPVPIIKIPEDATPSVNTPEKKSTPTQIVVTPPHSSSTLSPHRGPHSPNWRSRSRGANRSRSPLSQRSETSNMPVPMLYRNMSPSPRRTTTPGNNKCSSPKPSVKHLTCWWWHEKGQCRYSEEECLYAHYETGLVADAPRQVRPGGKSYVHFAFTSASY